MLALPGAAGAAGLGKLVVLSAFGEPFRAEIDLLSYQDEWSTRGPRLAPPDAYKLADFRYSPALAGARLSIRKHPNGRDYVEVYSARAVNEPIVYLLIELEWNATRIVRGYTVLLDPPGFGPPPVAVLPAYLPAARLDAAVDGALRRLPTANTAAIAAAAQPKVIVRSAPRDLLASITATTPALSARIQVLEERMNTSAKTLSGLLERIASMEETVRRLQKRLETQNARAAAPKPEAVDMRNPVAPTKTASAPAVPDMARAKSALPAPPQATAAPEASQVVAPQPQATAPAGQAPELSTSEPRPRRAWRPPDSLLNEALMVLAGGSLLLLAGIVYWMWNRPQLKGAAAEEKSVTTEDILTKLLARDPEREDVQLKLLEIYAGREDGTGYQNVAVKFHKLTGGQGDAWLKVASTGFALDPGNPLYTAGRHAVIVASMTDNASQVRH